PVVKIQVGVNIGVVSLVLQPSQNPQLCYGEVDLLIAPVPDGGCVWVWLEKAEVGAAAIFAGARVIVVGEPGVDVGQNCQTGGPAWIGFHDERDVEVIDGIGTV